MVVKKNNKNTSYVNANVNEVKEEKVMAKANTLVGKRLHNKQHSVGEERILNYARWETIGMSIAKIISIQMIMTKKPGNPDKGTEPEFHMALKVTFEVDGVQQPVAFINDYIIVKENGERLPINPYFADYDHRLGRDGYYDIIKKTAWDKAIDELEESDSKRYILGPNQTIWSALEDEYTTLARALEISDLEFDEEGFVKMPKNYEIPIYVYEERIPKTTTKSVVKNGKPTVEKKTEYKPYFNISFVPTDKRCSFGKPLYDKYFSRTVNEDKEIVEDIQHEAECLKQPGVLRYIESLRK